MDELFTNTHFDTVFSLTIPNKTHGKEAKGEQGVKQDDRLRIILYALLYWEATLEIG
jgi:hypothetical protein